VTYTIIGDAVNLAARVMAHAPPGSVLATAEVMNRSQALFEVEELPPFTAKGKKAPVVAYRIGPVTAERVRRARARFRLAGRQAELAALVEEVDALDAAPGRIVHLVGPAGIGKSRLVDELSERRPSLGLAVASCSRYESATPYDSVGGLLRKLLDLTPAATADDLADAVLARAPELRDQVPLIGAVVGIDVADTDATRDLTAGFRAERAVQAVCDLLDSLVGDPAVVVVEDVHWIDPESLAVVRALAKRNLPRRRWLLVLTSRHPVVLDPELDVPERTVELRPLSDAASRELVLAAVEEGLVSLERGQLLLERAGGNPFFLEELLRVGGDDELPDSVDALVQTQLDQLPVDDRQLLADLAVLGTDVDLDLFAATAGTAVDVVAASLARLGDFVERTAPRTFRFRHALVHDGAYSRLPFRRRRELHLRAAAALEADPARRERPELIALHTYHAHDWQRARSYALAAAEQASGRFANLTAAQQYRHAIESGRHIPDLDDGEIAATWERLGDALMLASSYEDAVLAYRRALRLAAPAHRVHLCGQIGQLRERQGRYGEALRWFTRATRLEASVRSGETARLLVESAIVRARQGKPADAVKLVRRADAHDPDLRTRARIAYVDAWCAMLLGEDGAEAQARTLRLFEEADDLIGQGLAYNIISMAAYYRGDWDEAARAYEQAAMLRRRVGDEVAAAAAAGNLGELLADQGHFERARGLLEECRTVCGAAGFQSSRYFATMTLGRLDARVGMYDRAEAQITEALTALADMKMAWLEFDAIRYLAELHLFRGDLEGALAGADRVDEAAVLGSAGFRMVGQRLRTCTLVACGDVGAARLAAHDLLGRLSDDARDYDSALSLAAAGLALDDAGDPAAGPVRARAAEALARLGVVVPAELLLFGPTSARSIGAAEPSVTGRVLVPAHLVDLTEVGSAS
jgi:tetratricopeptide (TPR) repeat protein